jgi:hypothetical protein
MRPGVMPDAVTFRGELADQFRVLGCVLSDLVGGQGPSSNVSTTS